MKTRSGFVSNSSSTSFAILGWKFSNESLEELLKKQKIEFEEDDLYYGCERLLVNVEHFLNESMVYIYCEDNFWILGVGNTDIDEVYDIEEMNLDLYKISIFLNITIPAKLYYGRRQT